MCLLLVCQPGSTPKRKDLECASCNNPHGFGYAVIAGDKIITGKGMSAKKTIKAFLEIRKQYPDSYAMYHARYATHGVKNDENCHPFKVGNDDLTYLAHNGILDVEIHATDRRSDTRVFAEDTLPAMGGVSALDDDNVWKILSKWASGSKIAVLTLDPKAKDVCYIINESAGHWDNDGIWWSNSTYKADAGWLSYMKTPSLKPYDSEYYQEAEVVGDYECQMCGAYNVEEGNPYYCDMCFTCYDCTGIYGDDCLCWSPEADQHAKQKRGAWYYDGFFDEKEYHDTYK
jgi:glutamine amidotransferase